MICVPGHAIPWFVISGGLVVGLIVIAAAADWLERRVQRRAVLRRIQPREHIHDWRLAGKVEGRTLLRCACGQELPPFDEGVDQ